MLFERFFQKKRINLESHPEMDPCLSGKEILQKYPQYLRGLRDQVSATLQVYENIYLKTLYRFAEFCQSMPDKEGSENYSLLQSQLNLSLTAIKLRKGLLLPLNAGAEIIAKEEPCWTYAIFTASLFYQLSRIQSDRTVTFYNANGEHLGNWHIFTGSLCNHEAFFKIQFKGNYNENDQSKLFPDEIVMSVLITRLLTKKIIHWMSKNTSLFTLWWETMTKPYVDNVISALIHKAADAINFNHVKDPIILNSSPPIQTSKVEAEKTKKTENLLKKLLNYLYEQTKSEYQTIDYLRVDEGLFVAQKTLHKFLVQEKDINIALFREENNIYFTYCPVNFQDRRVFKGILIKNDVLDEKWQGIAVQTNFQRELNETILLGENHA